jgi:hypothetical protein
MPAHNSGPHWDSAPAIDHDVLQRRGRNLVKPLMKIAIKEIRELRRVNAF